MANKTEQKPIVIHDLTLVAPNRNKKDVATLKAAIQRAESISVPNRVELYDLYHDVVTIDGHLSGLLQKRIKAVTNKKIQFVKNKKKVDELDELIENKQFNRLCELIMESRYWGVSAMEFIVGPEFKFVEIPRKHLRPEAGTIVQSQYEMGEVEQAWKLSELPYVWQIGEKKDLGILLTCSLYALYKRNGFADFSQFVEIFGQPVRIIRYDAFDTRTKQELQNMARTAGSSLIMMLPKESSFEMMDGKTSNATGDLQINFIQACNDEMSVAVLGNTETTGSSRSSGYAQAKVHSEEQNEIAKDDIAFVQSTLNEPHFLKILESYGYPVAGGAFEFEVELDLDNLTKRLAIDKEVALQVPIPAAYWYETYRIPAPTPAEIAATQEVAAATMTEKKTGETAGTPPAAQAEKESAQASPSLFAKLAAFFFQQKTKPIDLAAYYACGCGGGCAHRPLRPLADTIGYNWDNDEYYNELATQLLENRLPNGYISPQAYNATAARLIESLSAAISDFSPAESDNILASNLQRNLYSFSAAKNLTMLTEFRDAMIDEKGAIRSYTNYRDEIQSRGHLFNRVWLETEYNTALQSAIQAHRWDTLQADYLEYRTVGDYRVRPEHALLNRKTYPKDHPFWDKYYPPLAWGCRCTVVPGVEQNAETDDNLGFTRGIDVPPLFQNNVGKTQLVFNNNHPYYTTSGGQLKELTYRQYGLAEETDIRLRGVPVEQTGTRADFQGWWDTHTKAEGTNNVQLTDPNGIRITLSSKQKDKLNELLAINTADIIQRPHEIWDQGKRSVYFKVYKNKSIAVIVNNSTLSVDTMYPLTSSRAKSIRKGILKKKNNQADNI